MNLFEKRKLKEQREKELRETKDQSKIWNRHGISYDEYRKIYQKWKLAVKRGHDVSIDFYIENRKKKRIALYKKSQVYPLSTVLKKYDMTIEQYNQILEKQNGRCAICKDRPRSKKNLSVDHNHKTGQVRGLLCHHCNSGIGFFRDEVQTVLAAAEYLSIHAPHNS